MSAWQCGLPPETCPCICCQHERLKAEHENLKARSAISDIHGATIERAEKAERALVAALDKANALTTVERERDSYVVAAQEANNQAANLADRLAAVERERDEWIDKHAAVCDELFEAHRRIAELEAALGYCRNVIVAYQQNGGGHANAYPEISAHAIRLADAALSSAPAQPATATKDGDE